MWMYAPNVILNDIVLTVIVVLFQMEVTIETTVNDDLTATEYSTEIEDIIEPYFIASRDESIILVKSLVE